MSTFRLSVLLLFFLSGYAPVRAQVVDAFKGVYPEVEHIYTKNLSGLWKLQVKKGICGNDDLDFTLPDFDDSS